MLSAKDLAIAIAYNVFFLSPHEQRKIRLKAIKCDALIDVCDGQDSVMGIVLRGVIGSTFRRFAQNTKNIAALRNMTNGFSASLPSASYAAVRQQSIVPPETGSSSDTSKKERHTTFAAIFIETGFNPNFEFRVRNVLYHLGDGDFWFFILEVLSEMKSM